MRGWKCKHLLCVDDSSESKIQQVVEKEQEQSLGYSSVYSLVMVIMSPGLSSKSTIWRGSWHQDPIRQSRRCQRKEPGQSLTSKKNCLSAQHDVWTLFPFGPYCMHYMMYLPVHNIRCGHSPLLTPLTDPEQYRLVMVQTDAGVADHVY